MPVYVYQCEKDPKHRFEAQQRMKDKPLDQCMICKGPVHRVIGNATFVLKGNDWTTHSNREF